MKLIPYTGSFQAIWDRIVNEADNGHFMFLRSFMEYHQDRFEDCSFMVQEGNKLIGIFPGSKHDKKWHSHGGLTFGGLIIGAKNNRFNLVRKAYSVLMIELKSLGILEAIIKPVPWIYHKRPCQGELYWLAQREMIENRVELTTAVALPSNENYSKLRKRMFKRAEFNKITVQLCERYDLFWPCLSVLLKEKFGRCPVHSEEEIRLLANKFPENLLLFCVFDSEKTLLGGTLIFDTGSVWHAQYIASTENGRNKGALDKLFIDLIEMATMKGKKFFDFGISTEDDGDFINSGLVNFKEGFTGTAAIHQKITIQV